MWFQAASSQLSCCPFSVSSCTPLLQDECEKALFQSTSCPANITVQVRVSSLHGVKGVRSLLIFKTDTSTCRVSDVAAWIIGSQDSPPESVDLLHRGSPMNVHSALLDYDIASIPTIDAILSYPDVQKVVEEHKTDPDLWKSTCWAAKLNFASLPIPHQMLEPQSVHSKEGDKKAIDVLRRLKENAAGHQQHQALDSTLIHMFALIFSCRSGIYVDFDLDMGQSVPCVTVSDIKKSLLAQLEGTLLEMKSVLAAAEVVVMHTSARHTPLDDDHSLDESGVPSELCAIVSL